MAAENGAEPEVEVVDGELVPETGEVVGWLIRDGATIRADVREDTELRPDELVELIGLLVEELPPTPEVMTALMARIAPGPPTPTP